MARGCDIGKWRMFRLGLIMTATGLVLPPGDNPIAVNKYIIFVLVVGRLD